VLKFPTGHFMLPIQIAGSNPVGNTKDNAKEQTQKGVCYFMLVFAVIGTSLSYTLQSNHWLIFSGSQFGASTAE